jgi:hypothetical protein
LIKLRALPRRSRHYTRKITIWEKKQDYSGGNGGRNSNANDSEDMSDGQANAGQGDNSNYSSNKMSDSEDGYSHDATGDLPPNHSGGHQAPLYSQENSPIDFEEEKDQILDLPNGQIPLRINSPRNIIQQTSVEDYIGRLIREENKRNNMPMSVPMEEDKEGLLKEDELPVKRVLSEDNSIEELS